VRAWTTETIIGDHPIRWVCIILSMQCLCNNQVVSDGRVPTLLSEVHPAGAAPRCPRRSESRHRDGVGHRLAGAISLVVPSRPAGMTLAVNLSLHATESFRILTSLVQFFYLAITCNSSNEQPVSHHVT
jgi:hypothetical protein